MPETVDDMELLTLQKMLDTYCEEKGGKNDNLSTKRMYCKELHGLMLNTCDDQVKERKGLKRLHIKRRHSTSEISYNQSRT